MASDSEGDKRTSQPPLDDETRQSIERLVAARPDLALRPVGSLGDLKQRANRHDTLQHCVDHLNRLDHEVLETLMAAGPLHSESLGVMAGGVEAAELAKALERLEHRWLVRQTENQWRTGTIGALNLEHPTGLGRPVSDLADNLPDSKLSAVLRLLGGTPHPRKSKMVSQLCAIISDADTLSALLDTAPEPARRLVQSLVDGPPTVQLPYAGVTKYSHPDLYWLMERGFLLPSRWSVVELPREAGIALRGGRIIAESSPRPALTTSSTAAEQANAHVAQQVVNVIAQIDDVCSAIESLAPRCLKSGGVGVREAKRIAAATKLDEPTMTFMVELAYAANLITMAHIRMPPPKTKSGRPSRSTPPEMFEELVITERCNEWRTLPLGERWLLLARSWLSVHRHLSTSGRRNDEGKFGNLLDDDDRAQRHLCRRFAVLSALRDLGDVQVLSKPDDLAAYAAWHAYGLFRATKYESVSSTVAIELLQEAATLGLWVDQRLSPLAHFLLDTDYEGATTYLNNIAPAATDEITVQADGTIMVAGMAEAQMLQQLLRFADVSSRDVALLMRIDEQSVRRALDNGMTAENIIDVLAAHSPKGVPQAVRYLVDDVARRHGHVVVGDTRSFLQSDDPGVLADVVRHRALAKHQLRLLAPTVAVSSAEPGELLEALRNNGFLPTLESGTHVSIDAPERTIYGPSKAAFEVSPTTSHAVATSTSDFIDQISMGEPTSSGKSSFFDDEATIAALKSHLEEVISEALVKAGVDAPNGYGFGPLSNNAESIRETLVQCWIERVSVVIGVPESAKPGAELSLDVIYISQYDGRQLTGKSLFGGEVIISLSALDFVLPVHPANEEYEWSALD